MVKLLPVWAAMNCRFSGNDANCSHLPYRLEPAMRAGEAMRFEFFFLVFYCADEIQLNPAAVRSNAVFDQIGLLPGAECEAPFTHR